MTIAYLFPGQGSHRVGMGRHLFPKYPNLVRQAESVLGYSIADLCLQGPEDRLNDTRYTQCAMYVVGALSYIDEVRNSGVIPDLLAGHSLGEYVALFAGGAFDFRTGLELVAERARLMGAAGPGAMAAVIGLEPEEIRTALTDGDGARIDIANFNAPDQTVISGPPPDIDAISATLRERGATVIALRVSGAFHSRYMAPAAEEFAGFIGRRVLSRLKLAVISNVTAEPYADDIGDLLVRQLTSPVRWSDTVRYLLGHPDAELREVGPGTVLTGLTKRIEALRTPAAVTGR